MTATAEAARLIRPFDTGSAAALRCLAHAFGAHIEPGLLVLAGRQRAALLVVTRRGDIIAAVLLDAAEGDDSSHHSPDSLPHSACTDASVACVPDAKGVPSDDH